MGEKYKSGYDVFISFESSNKEIARQFYDGLNEKGFSVFFFPESQISGDNYEKRIHDAIKKSSAFLLICNAYAKASEKVQDECRLYVKKNGAKQVFIFEAPGFKEEHIPNFKNWKTLHRVSDIGVQIKHIEKWYENTHANTRSKNPKSSFPVGKIIFFTALLVAVAGFFLFSFLNLNKTPKININITHRNNAFVKDTTIDAGETIDLERLLTVSPEKSKHNIVWIQNNVPVLDVRFVKDSGLYVASIAENKDVSDSLWLHIEQKDSVVNENTSKPPSGKPITSQQSEISKTIQGATIINGNKYVGALKNGKPEGNGKLEYASRSRVSENDSKQTMAEPGDYLEGAWFEGRLEYGTLYDKSGTKKGSIIIGR